MQVMGISGLPGSGKGLVSDMATEKGAIIVSMGDIIREEAKKRGESTKETAKNLRKEHGEYIVSELTIKKIKEFQKEGNENSIVVDGIRSHHEVEMFKENFDDFIILSIFANPTLRFKRLQDRMRADDSKDYKEFAKSLSLLDEVILVDIYPAREKPIPGVTSKLIYDNLRPGIEKRMCHKEDIPNIICNGHFEVLIALGAGDIDNYIPTSDILKNK